MKPQTTAPTIDPGPILRGLRLPQYENRILDFTLSYIQLLHTFTKGSARILQIPLLMLTDKIEEKLLIVEPLHTTIDRLEELLEDWEALSLKEVDPKKLRDTAHNLATSLRQHTTRTMHLPHKTTKVIARETVLTKTASHMDTLTGALQNGLHTFMTTLQTDLLAIQAYDEQLDGMDDRTSEYHRIDGLIVELEAKILLAAYRHFRPLPGHH